MVAIGKVIVINEAVVGIDVETGNGGSAIACVNDAAIDHGEVVIVLDGDGAVLMNMGTLCTIADQCPKNLVHVIWDNGQWGETGGQPNHCSGAANLAAVARGAGIEKVEEVTEMEDFQRVFLQALKEGGPWCVVAKVEDRSKEGKIPPFSADANRQRFMQSFT